jgi:hypothetical protein
MVKPMFTLHDEGVVVRKVAMQDYFFVRRKFEQHIGYSVRFIDIQDVEVQMLEIAQTLPVDVAVVECVARHGLPPALRI